MTSEPGQSGRPASYGTRWRRPIAILVAFALGAGGMLLAVRPDDGWPWGKSGTETRSGLGTEILVMRTQGGLLEVARIRADEQFDKKFLYTVMGLNVGETVAHIRVPATYRYHIELAPEWDIYQKGDVFKVITPPIKPSLPVAVDLAKMQKDVGGTWILVPFNEVSDLEALQREITAMLEQKAKSDVYRQLQRVAARKTVTEFVEKWLVTEQAWKTSETPRVEVVFGE